ncbi:unnamed protein product [Trifolium pratense]|uniref:Uncharacterized protein n=1 Tax=Trifolium pratense TaxID=57577 RepID=A0ACB0KG66_TRIPR|nr:unnamed protein product [Trifolium pratense]
MGDPITDKVFEATWNSLEAAVKIVPIQSEKANIEIKAYQHLNDVPRVVRCFDHLKDENHHYIFLQRAKCNLRELINACKKKGVFDHQNENCRDFLKKASKDYRLWHTPDRHEKIRVKGAPDQQSASPDLLTLIRDIIDGVTDLQKKKIRHENLTPDNILIFEEINEPPYKNRLRAKISNLGSSSPSSDNLVLDTSTAGWRMPEKIKQKLTDEKSDLLGLVICFCLTASHAFGNDENVRHNIMDTSVTSRLSPVDKDFITGLLKALPDDRSVASSLLLHPTFWDDTTKAWFIWEINDLLHRLDWAEFNQFNLKKQLIFNGYQKWDCFIDHEVLMCYTKDFKNDYNEYSLQSLVKMFRNICAHLNEYEALGLCVSTRGKIFVGKSKASVYRSLIEYRFPRLLIEAYNHVKLHRQTDEPFEWLFPK